MRKTMSFAIAALLAAAVVGSWTMSYSGTAQSEPGRISPPTNLSPVSG